MALREKVGGSNDDPVDFPLFLFTCSRSRLIWVGHPDVLKYILLQKWREEARLNPLDGANQQVSNVRRSQWGHFQPENRFI
jgi:hypothetical protein